MLFVKLLIDIVIFQVKFDIGLEIVPILLLFFGEVSKEVSIVLGPSLPLVFEHSLFSSLVVDWIGHGSGIELLYFIEHPVEFHDRLLGLVPVLIHVSAKWHLESKGELVGLLLNEFIGSLECVHLLVDFLESL